MSFFTNIDNLVIISIALAIFLCVLGFVLLIKYKNFDNDKTILVDEKLQELNSVLESCDKMIHELNKLSDYLMTNVENKGTELKELLSKSDMKINDMSTKLSAIQKSIPSSVYTKEGLKVAPEEPLIKEKEDNKKTIKVQESILEKVEEETDTDFSKYLEKKVEAKEKEDKKIAEELTSNFSIESLGIDNKKDDEKEKRSAFVVSSKAKDVIELSNQGMGTTEIAKKLGIGKGEIELILGLKK